MTFSEDVCVMNFFYRGDHMCYYCVVCLFKSDKLIWNNYHKTVARAAKSTWRSQINIIFGRPSNILTDSFCIHNCFEIANTFLRYLVYRQFFWPRFKIRSWSLSTISGVDTSEGLVDRVTCCILNLLFFRTEYMTSICHPLHSWISSWNFLLQEQEFHDGLMFNTLNLNTFRWIIRSKFEISAMILQTSTLQYERSFSSCTDKITIRFGGGSSWKLFNRSE